jgi:hypothetical protein
MIHSLQIRRVKQLTALPQAIVPAEGFDSTKLTNPLSIVNRQNTAKTVPHFQQLELDLGITPIGERRDFRGSLPPKHNIKSPVGRAFFLGYRKARFTRMNEETREIISRQTLHVPQRVDTSNSNPSPSSRSANSPNFGRRSNTKEEGTMHEEALLALYDHPDYPTSRPDHNRKNGAFDFKVGPTWIEAKSTQLLDDTSNGKAYKMYRFQKLFGVKDKHRNETYEKGNTTDFWYGLTRPYKYPDPQLVSDIDLDSDKSPYHHYLIHRKDLLYLLLTRRGNFYAKNSEAAKQEAAYLESLEINAFRDRAKALRLSNVISQRWKIDNPIVGENTPHGGNHPEFELIKDFKFTPQEIQRILHNPNPAATYNTVLQDRGLHRDWFAAPAESPQFYDPQSNLSLFTDSRNLDRRILGRPKSGSKATV